MVRLSRSESQALTRQKLIEAATQLFKRDGYATTSVDRIADEAGFSKGAVYSNFETKEAIFLAVLERQGRESLDQMLAALAVATSRASIIDRLSDWADERSQSGSWSLTILEHARAAGRESPSVGRQAQIIRFHWRQVGEHLLARFPAIDTAAETLGALLHEIAYAPALTFISPPSAGVLMRLTLEALLPAAEPQSTAGTQ